MMTSSRPRGDVGGSFASRRGHASQLSISDPSHHVTEAIGTLYGDEDDYPSDNGRPLSFMPSAQPEQIHKHIELSHSLHDDTRLPLLRTTSDQSGVSPQQHMPNGTSGLKKSNTLSSRSGRPPAAYDQNGKTPASPTLSLRDVQNDSSQFPLGNIENPSDIALELSNLQALRRMSMDVGNTSDPDLLPFGGMSLTAMPSIAPSGGDDEGDPSRLLWVPAAVHPELAPTEFKNFLENRVKSIKRRSGDAGGLLSPEGLDRSDSSGLRRKKSMLSRQIDTSSRHTAENYIDGADRLDPKRSSDQSATELSLDELVKDPSGAVKKLAQEAQQPGLGPEASPDDMPILPMAPGMGLRRSTRTTYRKGGSLRSGERLSFNKRTSGRKSQQGDDAQPDTTIESALEAPKGHGLTRVQSEPISENFSRPSRPVRRQQKFSDQDAYSSLTGGENGPHDDNELSSAAGQDHQLPIRTTSAAPESRGSVPQILETPAPEDEEDHGSSSMLFPRRSSSQNTDAASQQTIVEEPPARSSKRPSITRTTQSSPSPPVSYQQQQAQQLRPQQQQQQQQPQQSSATYDPAFHPSALPGGGASRTDSLAYIPTLPPDERKVEKKSKKDDDSASTKSTGWSKWLKGSSGDDKKEKKQKDEEKKKSKSFVEKAHDNVRLDVLQSSIESAVTKGRESLLLDRDNMDAKLTEERRKESSRKSETPKKEKEGGGLFSGLFGGGKKKADRESRSAKGHHLRVSEDPVYKPLKPDVDYHWTRFPLLEERAIYRMAHLKLANPRRSLASQVLLSNFMYNYLAIVQAMHPQVQVPQSPAQRRAEEERRRKEQEEQYLAQQQQAQEEADQDAMDQYNFEYHRDGNQYGDNNNHEGVDYVDEAQIYEYDHGGGADQAHGGGYDGYGGNNQQQQQQAQQQGYPDHYGHDRGDKGGRRDDRDDMW